MGMGGGAASLGPVETAAGGGAGARIGVGVAAGMDLSGVATGMDLSGVAAEAAAGAGRALSRGDAGARFGATAADAVLADIVCGASTPAGGGVFLTIKSAASAASSSAGLVSSGRPSLSS